MKLNKKLVEEFELDQKQYGTETALYNVIWSIAAELLKGIGVRNIKTIDKKKGDK